MSSGQVFLPRSPACRAPICSVVPLRPPFSSSDQLAMWLFVDILGAALLEATPLPDQTSGRHSLFTCCTSRQLRNPPAPRSPGFFPTSFVETLGSLFWSLVLPSSVLPGSLSPYQPWLEFVRRHEGPLRPPLGRLLGWCTSS